MINPIRKISVGYDYKNCMQYAIGQPCVNKTHTICRIKQEDSNEFTIEIINSDSEVKLWKRIIDQPVFIEYNILNE